MKYKILSIIKKIFKKQVELLALPMVTFANHLLLLWKKKQELF